MKFSSGLFENKLEEKSRDQQKRETTLNSREQQLNRKFDVLDKKEHTLQKQENLQSIQEEQLAAKTKHVDELKNQHQKSLEEIAGISQSDARQIILNQLEENAFHPMT